MLFSCACQELPAPEAVELVAVPVPVSGPRQLGYMHDRSDGGRALARVTPLFKGSVAVKCYLHPSCTCAMAEWKLPSLSDLRAWAFAGERLAPDAAPAARAAAKDRHQRDMKEMRDSAVWPGRSRQAIVDEAIAMGAVAAPAL